MTMDVTCKNKIFSTIDSYLNNLSPFIQGIARNKAREMIMQLNSGLRDDLHLTLEEYIKVHPEVKAFNPTVFEMIPPCAYKHTIQDIKDCLIEIKGQI